MGFFDSFKNIKNQINQYDSTVASGSSSLLDAYERNIKLEKEIAIRTHELDMANKQMLTLQHIWDMMNSSKPLSSVLNAIVNSLQGEFGYLYSFILKQKYDKDGAYLKVEASSREDIGIKLAAYTGCNLFEYKVCPPKSPSIIKAIDENRIYQSVEIESLVLNMVPNVDKNALKTFLNNSKMASYILIPLKSQHSFFGTLIVLSSRENATKNELNFLKLFAKQIEHVRQKYVPNGYFKIPTIRWIRNSTTIWN